MVALYLGFKFHIFNTPILEEDVSQVEGGPHLFQSCLHVAQDNFPPTIRKMHLFFESLVIISALGL
jgi:hypothetical protein